MAIKFCLGIALAICVLANPVRGEDERFSVGVGKVDITPDYPIRLNGFGFRRAESEGVSQRVWAKALAISQKDEPPLLLIAIDNLGVRLPQVDEVARRLRERFGVPRERVALTFTHTHCAPKVNGASDNIFSTPIPSEHQEHIDRYTRELTDRLEQAAAEAIADRRESHLAWTVGKVGFAKNRRTQGGPVDHDLPLLVVRDLQGQVRALYVSYACHCVTLSFNQISGDWAGYAQELIERKFPGATALVSIGCGSDSNPSSGVTGDKTDIAAQQGAEIADEVARLVAGELRPLAGPLTARINVIDLPLNDAPTPEQLGALVAKGGPPGYNAQTQLARLSRGESLLAALRYPIQTFTFGDRLHMVLLGGEVCVDYSHRLKRELNRERLWLNGYSNDFGAYIPSERLVKEGGYGGGGEIPYFALPATLQAGLEQKIIDEVRRQTPPIFHAAGTQGVAPKSPEESMQCLQTHDSLRVELVASEPLVADPVAIDFAPDGKLWVVEMTDYARGVNDEFAPQGRVRLLSDTDHDGRFDQASDFLTDLRFPTDVKVWRDGVLVCDAPDILFAADTNGDGKADVRKVLFTGFATHNPHARVNSLRWGLDGWVHGSGGLFGGQITSFNGNKIDLTNRDFRLNPDTGEIEPTTGRTQQGRPRDDWDHWFGCTNGTLLTHYVVEDRYARRNPHVAPPAASRYVPDYPDSNQLFPRGDLVLFKLSGAPGRPTSACGAEIYRDDLLGAEFYGNAFTCEPVNQLVHRLVLTRNGESFSGRRAPEEAKSEFLTSTDRWFRPVQVRTGPDGALWIVDMYRYVIEHPQWIPAETLAELDVMAGRGLGRIYRIVPKKGETRATPSLDVPEDSQLAAAIDSPNGVRRDLAHQLLLWRKAEDAAPSLERIAKESERPAARVQAAVALADLEQLRPDVATPLLSDESPEVRRLGVRLCEAFLTESPDVLDKLLALKNDPDLAVCIQLAQSLGESDDPRAASALAAVALRGPENAYLNAAALSSVRRDNVLPVLAAALEQTGYRSPRAFVESVYAIAPAIGDPEDLGLVFTAFVRGVPQAARAWRWSTLGRMLDSADRARLTLDQSLDKETLQDVRRLWQSAQETADDPRENENVRLAAIALLGRSEGSASKAVLNESPSERASLLASLTSAQHPPAIQSAAVQGLLHSSGRRGAEALLACWPSASLKLRGEILDALLSRDAWMSDLLAALEAGQLKSGDFDATRRQRLLAHSKEEIRLRVEAAFSSLKSDRAELLAEWQSVATLPSDASRGKEAFRKRCAACHQLEGVGSVVGPDLAALTSKSFASLLTAILDPDREVDGRYVNYIAQLADGRTLTGVLVSESGGSVVLREKEGKDHVLLRADLEAFKATGKSAMPEGLEKDVSRQEMADVIAYVMASRTPPKTFAGNSPQVVAPDKQGVLPLMATQAEVYGQEIIFETDSPYRNLGYWHGANDFAQWQVQLEKAAKYDVYLDYSCAEDSAGNGVRLEGGQPVLRGVVKSTGAWSDYRLWRLGTLELSAGRSALALRYDGEKKRPALLDLRAIFLAPPEFDVKQLAPAELVQAASDDPEQIARLLLDDSQPAAARERRLAKNPSRTADILIAMGRDISDEKEEYRRIPWIWRVAIAAGKRNQSDEIKSVLLATLPALNEPLRHWQAVAIGGGIINGISQAGDWPKARIEGLIKGEGVLIARWQRALELASAIADDEAVPKGARYDALRMIALSSWELRGRQLEKYLEKGAHEELQMGAVSGVADMPAPQATQTLLVVFSHLSPRNRELALDALLRSPARMIALLDAISAGKVSADSLGAARRTRLLEADGPGVRQRAVQALGSVAP